MFATDPAFNHTIKGYDGQLLHMAKNLADRLMPAFKSTKTGIPYPRVKTEIIIISCNFLNTQAIIV